MAQPAQVLHYNALMHCKECYEYYFIIMNWRLLYRYSMRGFNPSFVFMITMALHIITYRIYWWCFLFCSLVVLGLNCQIKIHQLVCECTRVFLNNQLISFLECVQQKLVVFISQFSHFHLSLSSIFSNKWNSCLL